MIIDFDSDSEAGPSEPGARILGACARWALARPHMHACGAPHARLRPPNCCALPFPAAETGTAAAKPQSTRAASAAATAPPSAAAPPPKQTAEDIRSNLVTLRQAMDKLTAPSPSTRARAVNSEMERLRREIAQKEAQKRVRRECMQMCTPAPVVLGTFPACLPSRGVVWARARQTPV